MLHLVTLFLVSLQRIQYGNFYIFIADDNAEEAGLVPVKLGFVCLGFCHPLHIPTLLLNGIRFLQPMVMPGFQVYRTDILDITDVLTALVKQADDVAPSTKSSIR